MTDNQMTTYLEVLATLSIPKGKKQTILAALELFSKQGYDGTSTAEIAAAARVSQATVFKYFVTKENLLLEVINPVLPALFGDFFNLLKDKNDLEEAVDFIVVNRLTIFEVNYPLLQIVFQEVMVNASLKKHILALSEKNHILSKMGSWLETLKEANPTVNQDLDLVSIIRCIIGPMLAYFGQRYIMGIASQDPEMDIAIIKKQILAGITN